MRGSAQFHDREIVMATNLVSLIMQFLTPDLVARIAATLGLGRTETQAGVSAAVPALLAAFSGVADKPGGSQNLVDVIKNQPGVLDNVISMVGGGSPASLIDKGSNLLGSLVGSHDQSALAGAVGKFAGIGQSTGGSLVGILAPVVMGVIGKQIGSRGLDAGSVGSLLASQKEQIAQALPQGFAKLLGDTGILDSLDGAAETAAAAASHAGRTANAAAGQMGQVGSSAGRSAGHAGELVARAAAPAPPNWLYWAIPALVVGGLLFYLFGRGTEQVAYQPTPREQVTPRTPLPPTKQVTEGTAPREQGAARMAPAAQSVVVGGVDIGKQLGDDLSNLRTSLAGIADVASAKAALPKLQEATAGIEKVNSMVPQLSADQRLFVSNMVAPAMTAINQLFEKALAIPGVGDVLKPTADNLKIKLADLSSHSSTVGER
jgi:Bacterial protein of unknown function (DUF937)